MHRIDTPQGGKLPYAWTSLLAFFCGGTARYSIADLSGPNLARKGDPGSRALGGTPFLKLALLLGVLFIYTALLEFLGFVLGTFLLLLFLFRVVEPVGWKTVILVTVLTMGGTYLLFGILIESSLPKGFLGF